jgi:hypothetical protein
VKTLDDERAASVEALCDLLVPGSAEVGPAVYIDAVLTAMPPAGQAQALAAIDALSRAAPGGTEALAELERTPEFAFVRALAIEAYYSDFVAPGRDAPGAYADIDFNTPLARRIDKDWSFMGIA